MLFLSRKFSKYILAIGLLVTFLDPKIIKSETVNLRKDDNAIIDSSYLNSREGLEDYIIDNGDNLYIDFNSADELSGFYSVNDEGEIFLPRLNETFVRGLTTSEIEKFLKEKYSEFLISPEINIQIAIFRDINITISGEVKYPGVYNFPAYKSNSIENFPQKINSQLPSPVKFQPAIPDITSRINESEPKAQNNLNNPFSSKNKGGDSKNNSDATLNNPSSTTLADVIKKAGGITTLTDLKKIEIIRDIPLGKGGGKKIAVVDFNSFIYEFDETNDLRLFDGDRIFIPSLINQNKAQVPKSVLTGLSPRFVNVNIFRAGITGEFSLPLESTLSDAIDITGPIKPLSGKIILIRYNADGTVSKKKISYSANAQRGSKRNPYIKEGDLITVTNSFFGRTTELIKEVTSPFIGIYSTRQLIDN